MVNYRNTQLDHTFMALADPTRRQIIGMLVQEKNKRVKELAQPFDMSLAAVSKHIKVLERAKLVKRYKQGREHYLELNPKPLREVKDWVGYYENFWLQRFSALEKLLKTEATKRKAK